MSASDPSNLIDLQTRVLSGPKLVDRLGELALAEGARRVLVVTDPGVMAIGHAQRGMESLRASGLEVGVFEDVHQDPTTLDAQACASAMADHRADFLVGLGGGSSIDTAKAGNFLFTNGGEMRDYWGFGKAAKPMLPLIAVPTTAGTGSEVQSYALIADAESHTKMACGDRKAAPRVALLDPTLTLSVPHEVTAHTGMDTVTHAVECAVTRTASPFSSMLAREAFRLGHTALPQVLAHPADLDARGRMQTSACLAGMAIEASMLGAAHALANPLTASFDLPHGEAVGLFLPGVVRFNGRDPYVAGAYRDLAVSAGICAPEDSSAKAVMELVARLGELLDLAGMPRSIAACGVKEGDLPALAGGAASQWTAGHNPVPVSEADLLMLYQGALSTAR